MEPQDGKYLIGFMMEKKYYARVVKPEEAVRLIHNAPGADIKDLYRIVISEEGKFDLQQVSPDSVSLP